MSARTHLKALEGRHSEIGRQIEDAYLHHIPDQELKRLKILKLKIKEQMFDFEKALSELADEE